MDMLKIGVLCPSEIAIRRFLPALLKMKDFEFGGVSVASSAEWTSDALSPTILAAEREKAANFGGHIFDSYESMLSNPDIQCVYIPLPPGLHFEWAKKALQYGKHVFVEKPCTDSLEKTKQLTHIAKESNLALHENYMFVFHSQLGYIKKQIQDGVIGDVRLYRIDFTFPFKGSNDFRYNKHIGGGALLDCGGYTLKLGSLLLGDTTKVVQSHLNKSIEFEVDIYGNVVMMNNSGITAQVSFGMDNCYRCSLEVFGSKGRLFTNRIFSAPCDFTPSILIDDDITTLPFDDTFLKSLQHFYNCILSSEVRQESLNNINKQAELVAQVEMCNLRSSS